MSEGGGVVRSGRVGVGCVWVVKEFSWTHGGLSGLLLFLVIELLASFLYINTLCDRNFTDKESLH